MRYLKTYESLNSTIDWVNSIIENCKDIMLELVDDGAEIIVSKSISKLYKNRIEIEYKAIYNKYPKKSYLIINDVFNRISDYLSLNNFEEKNRNIILPDYLDGKWTTRIVFTSPELDSDYIGNLRYLKRYSINESLNLEEDIKQTIKDISQELLDDDYIRLAFGERNKYAFLRTKDPEKCLNWDDIKDTCLRIKDYLGDRFIEFKWREHPSTRKDSDNLYNYTNLNEKTIIDRPIWAVAIEYDIVEKIKESNNNGVVATIEDIFLDVKDIYDSYEIEIYDFNDVLGSNIEDKIMIEISRWYSITPGGARVKRTSFSLDEIEDTIHRIINYMSSIGYKNTHIISKLRAMDDWSELVMKEGDYTRYKQGSFEWKFDKPISRLKIEFRK
jgi:hypothetical protein